MCYTHCLPCCTIRWSIQRRPQGHPCLLLRAALSGCRISRRKAPAFFCPCRWRLRRWTPSSKRTSPHDGPPRLHDAGLGLGNWNAACVRSVKASPSTQPSQDGNSVFIRKWMQPRLTSNDTRPRKLEPGLFRDRGAAVQRRGYVAVNHNSY